MEPLPHPERRFVQAGLPWAIAAAALLTYLATLNRWLTLSNMAFAGDICGWHSQPALTFPVMILLTWPLRWLPAGWVPLGLNVFVAVCAALTMALLARSVALLPHDRLEQERLLTQNNRGLLALPNDWVPPVLAAVALGLQLTFWENATAGSGEILELLLLAAVIWCVLEYRCDPRLAWLDRASLISGLALANSWAMAAFLPLVAVALVLSKRLRFFNLRFLKQLSSWTKARPALAEDGRFFLRMILFGLAGLSLILLLPLAHSLSPYSSLSFWQALREGVMADEAVLLLLVTKVFRYHREATLLLAVVSLVPVLLMSIRWRQTSSYASSKNLDPVSVIIYSAHAFLLVLCVMVVFDPPFSPRQLSLRLGVALPFLPLYYLVALSLGYYSGFFLLIFSNYQSRRRPVLLALHRIAPVGVFALLALTAAGLLWKNLPTIRLANGHGLEQYARFMVDSLPPGGAVVCSSDPTRLALLHGELDREGKAGHYVAVEASSLPSERYRAWLRSQYPRQWTEPAGHLAIRTNTSPDLVLLQLLNWAALSNRVCYLHPGSGRLLEVFYLQPHGLVYDLQGYATNVFESPRLTSPELAANEALWKRADQTSLDALARAVTESSQPPPGLSEQIMERAHLSRPLPDPLRVLARWYSSALNSWAVALQRNDQWHAAAPCLTRARELNPDNLPALVNLYCNSNHLASQPLTLVPPSSVADQFAKVRNVEQVLTFDGPFDEPSCCYQLGLAYKRLNLWRQACQLFERAHALAPREALAGLELGDLLSLFGMPDRALRITTDIEANLKQWPPGTNVTEQLAFVEARAWLVKTNRDKAVAVLQALLDSNPGDFDLMNRVKAAFASVGSFTNALRITEQELQLTPNNLRALVEKGLLCLRLGEFSNAVPVFTRALSLTNAYGIRIYRAASYLHLGQWDESASDYKEALRLAPTSSDPFYGLAEIASRRGDTNAANQYYLQGISNALLIVGEQLRRTPDHVPALMDKGVLLIRGGEFSNAVPVFTRVLSLTNSYAGWLNRALAYLQNHQLDAAESDYRKILQLFPASYQPYYGLAEVAMRRGNTNAAIQQYQQYLSKAPTNQAEFRQVTARLNLLQTRIR